jgi:sirohydrochlorin ferrochelatase
MIQKNDDHKTEGSGKRAVILIGHGSRAAGADDDMERVAESLRRRRGGIVELCRMAGRGTLFTEAFEKCIRQEVQEIIVIPYFLHFGVHLRQDIPEMLREAAAKHPEVRLVLGRHLGYDDSLVSLLEQRIKESRQLCDIRELAPAPIDRRPGEKEGAGTRSEEEQS